MIQIADVPTLPIWPGEVPDAQLWQDAGPELDRPVWEDSRLVRNVTVPTLTVFAADPAVATGTGVVVCPGGAFHLLMVDKEGSEVATWLNRHGVTVFVLKYRLAPTPDADEAMLEIARNPMRHRDRMDVYRPHSVADGLQAVRVVRAQADRWHVAADRIGIMGFSAGGAVTLGAAMRYEDAASRPDFAAPIYAAADDAPVPADAPPLFLATAADDPLVAPSSSIDAFEAWRKAGRRAELHVYAGGGHGFGMNHQGLPSDGWIDRFWEWLQAEGFASAG